MTPGRAMNTPFLPHHDETLPDWQSSPHRDQPAPANGMWQPSPGLTSYDTLNDDASSNFDAPSNGTAGWADFYGTGPADCVWDPPANTSTALSPYYTAPAWPLSPSMPSSSSAWSPNDPPSPSPVSEAPPYVFTPSRLGDDDDDDLDIDQASPATTPQPSPATPSQRASSVSSSTARTPTPSVPPQKSKSKKKPAKRPSDATTKSRPGRPGRPPKRRHNSSSTPSDTTPPPKTLGGVLPANVDPRVASERIKREAWERCKAEAAEMLQRRMLLRDHEHGALEREAQRLQVNLGLMREKVKGRGRGEGSGEGA